MILLIISALVGCNATTKKITTANIKEGNTVQITSSLIMEETVFETPVYYFKSNIEGPKIAIIGGTHGDETAGYTAALSLLDMENYFIGEALLIPKANIIACNDNKRYSSGYKDLNRNYPGDINGTLTDKLAYEIVNTIKEFNATVIIDLHESRNNNQAEGTKHYLGETLIYGNFISSFLGEDIINEYNKKYESLGYDNFYLEGSSPLGSLNNYFGLNNTSYYVFTIETNRQLSLNKRVDEQLNMLDIILNLIWNEA